MITPNDLRFASAKFLQISKFYDRGNNFNVCLCLYDSYDQEILSGDLNVEISVLITKADKTGGCF